MEQNTNNTDLEKRLKTLESKFSDLRTEISNLEKNRLEVNNSLKSMENNFSELNKNVESVLSKINDLPKESLNSDEDKKECKAKAFFKKRPRPFRRLAINLLSGIYYITDKTVETTSGIRENFEDIIAEAQYEQQKRRMQVVKDTE